MFRRERGRHAARDGGVDSWDGDDAGEDWETPQRHSSVPQGRHSEELGDSGYYPQMDDAGYDDIDPIEEDAALVAEGPFDSLNPPSDSLDRVDLGSIKLPVVPGVSIHPQLETDGHVSAFVLVHAGSALQIMPFAAPRSEGAWAEIRHDLRVKLEMEGYWPRECEGDFDVELLANLPSQKGRQLVRFLGIDGPRWFIRAMFTGAAATDPQAGETLVAILRNAIVVRGSEPRPVRDPLPLSMPQQAPVSTETTPRRAAARLATGEGSASVATRPGGEPARVAAMGRATHRDSGYSPIADQTIEIRGLPFVDDDELALAR